MNTFATILEAITFNKVTYYTIQFEDEKYSEFEKFVLKHQDDESIHDEYNDLMSLIERLGNEIGAKSRYFTRNEGKAEALPPDWNSLSYKERKLHVKYAKNLRLYCMRLTDNLVFLFNGGVKESGPITAQESKTIRKYFESANILAAKVDEAMRDGQIKLNGLKLEIDKDFEIII